MVEVEMVEIIEMVEMVKFVELEEERFTFYICDNLKV